MTTRTPTPTQLLAQLARNHRTRATADAKATASIAAWVAHCYAANVRVHVIATTMGTSVPNIIRKYGPTGRKAYPARMSLPARPKAPEVAVAGLAAAYTARVQARAQGQHDEVAEVAAALNAGATWTQVAAAIGSPQPSTVTRFGPKLQRVAQTVVTVRGG